MEGWRRDADLKVRAAPGKVRVAPEKATASHPEGSAPHVQSTDRLSPHIAAEWPNGADPPLLIDVRTPTRARGQVDRRKRP